MLSQSRFTNVQCFNETAPLRLLDTVDKSCENVSNSSASHMFTACLLVFELNPRCTWCLTMGFWQPVTNLRDYVCQNPPAVTFFLCLLTLALSFICLSFYSYTHTLPNPDTAEVRTHLSSGLRWADVLPCSPFTIFSRGRVLVGKRNRKLCRLWLHACWCVSLAETDVQIMCFSS